MNEENVNERKKYTVLLIIGTAIGTAIIIIGSYFWFLKNDDKPAENNANNQQQQNNTQTNDNNEVNNNQVIDTEQKYENNLTSDENVESGVYGTVYLEGYAKTVEKSLCDDGPDICQGDEPTVNEVLFYVTNGKVDDIKEWFVTDENSKEYIPLGCLENDLIKFDAMANEFYKGDNPNSQENYFREIELDKTNSEKIIASNENNTITLKIEKKEMKKNIRMGLYRCNSLITGVEVVK